MCSVAITGDDDVHTRLAYTNGLQTKIAANNLLRKGTYPDAGEVLFAYNALGQQIWTKDQNGTVIETTFDDAGRETKRAAKTLGTGEDDWVRRIESAYDSLGRRDTVRRTRMTLPSGNGLDYTYSTGGARHDNPASRVSRIKDGTVTLVLYDYLGTGSVVGTGYLEADVMQQRFGSTSGTYPDLDRFNRVVVDKWTKDLSKDIEFVKFELTYDPNSNIRREAENHAVISKTGQ